MINNPLEIVIIVLLVFLISYLVMSKNAEASSVMLLKLMGEMKEKEQTTAIPQIYVTGGDNRYSLPPRPQRNWQNEQEIPIRGALDPIPTRGAPESYQQMGILTGATDGKVLPLYGRRVAPRSDRFQYYTRTDTYNPVTLPIEFKKKNCQDNLGCNEVMNGDEIDVKATGEKTKVTLYGFDGPRYVSDSVL